MVKMPKTESPSSQLKNRLRQLRSDVAVTKNRAGHIPKRAFIYADWRKYLVAKSRLMRLIEMAKMAFASESWQRRTPDFNPYCFSQEFDNTFKLDWQTIGVNVMPGRYYQPGVFVGKLSWLEERLAYQKGRFTKMINEAPKIVSWEACWNRRYDVFGRLKGTKVVARFNLP